MLLVRRLAAVCLPFALVLTSTGTALAAKPPVTPKPVVTSKPAASTSSTSATFAWTTAASTTYSCSLDGGSYVACTSPKTYKSLAANRTHSFALRAKHSGNYKASTWTYSWKIDTIPPTAPTIAAVPSPTNKTTASISFTDADTSVVSFRCSLDGATATACTSPKQLSGLTEGTHTLKVFALDAAGNAASASRSWVIDLTPPAAPTVVPPPSPTKSQSVSIAFSDSDPTVAGFRCSLDFALATPCTSPFTATGLAEGTHTLTVSALDSVGNSAGTSTAWVVDLTAPGKPVLVSGPAAHTASTSATVVFGDSDNSAVAFRCQLDAEAAAPCTTTWTRSGLAAGSHTLQVSAGDAAGNWTTPTSLVTWTVDAAAWAPVITGGPAFLSNVKTPSFTFTAAYPTQCSVDGSAFASCTSPYTTGTLADGPHTFSVVALNGGTPSDPATYAWNVDTVGPSTAPLGGPAPAAWVKVSPTFSFTTTDPDVASFVCSVDSGAFTTCTSPSTPSLPDGPHTLVIATVDQAGNTGPTISYAWTLDRKAPTASFNLPTTSLTAPVGVRFTEDVLGVTTSSVQLRLTGTTTVVPTRLGCLSGTNAVVACTGVVRGVVVTPVSRLVPGQKYALVVTSAVHDRAGNAAAVPAALFRALRAIQESNLAMVQGWSVHSSSAALGGRYVQADLAGATASYAFRGSAITWYTATGPSMGTVRVYVDGTYKGLVNNYATTAHWRVGRTITRLTNAVHTLRLIATGARGSRNGTGSTVVLDAVRVGTTTVLNPVVLTRWATLPYTGGRFAVADQAADVVSMTFRGTSITWLGVLGRSMGVARVYIDGVLRGTYDSYAAATRTGVRRTWSLTDKVHTIKIVVLGTHRTGARGSVVAVDALLVG